MQSIETRYIGPTDKRGSRVKVTASGRKDSVTVEWDDALDSDGNHAAALLAAVRKWGDGWTRYSWVAGESKRGLVWVNMAPFAPRVRP